MTQLNISFEEAKKLAHVELSWLKARGWEAKIMGGFVRDSFLGAPVKDMDIYISPKNDQTAEVIDAMAKEFYEARGHEYILHQKEQRRNPPENSPYNEFLLVYQSKDVAEGDFPVDLIFTPTGYDHPGSFDIALCEQMMWLHPFDQTEVNYYSSRDAKRDIESKTLTIMRAEDGLFEQMNDYVELTDEQFEKAVTRMKAHVERVKAKYPDYRLVMELNNPTVSSRRLYARLQEENYFGETGEVLPTEAGLIERDAVRQLNREELVLVMRGEDPGLAVQGPEGTLPRGALVQPRLLDLEGDAFLQQILATAREREERHGLVWDTVAVPPPAPQLVTPAQANRRGRANPAPRQPAGPRGRFGQVE